ncbi:hypothetical protein Tco_0441823 [Tanacetum coccineum]
MSTLTFADTHNIVAFLEKPAESDGFHEIIDFLNANQIHYALTVNPTIYTSCIEQFWATAKAKTVNGERQLQALVDKKKVIITETSIRSDLHLEDAGGIDCLPTATIFEELARMGYEKPSQKLTFYKAFFSPQWKFLIHTITQCLSAKTTAWNEFSSTMASAIICLATNQKFNLSKYIFDAMKKQSRRKQKKTTAVPQPSDSTADVPNEEYVPIHSNDPLLSGEDRLKLTDLMDMCTKLSERVLDLEHSKTQAQEITNLKLRVKKLEKKTGLRTHKFERLYKGRSIEDIDKDAEVSLVDETQGRSDDAEMFDTDALIGNEVFAENDMIEKYQDVIPKEVSTAAPSTTVVPPPDITEVEITLAQILAKLKSAKSKVVIQEPVQSTTTTTPSTIPKAKGITFKDVGESITRTPTSVSSSSIKDKGKAKMDEPEVPLKKKDQIALDEEMARNLEAQIQAELIEEERLARKKEEEANIALIESWDNTQAMMEADFELAQRLQEEEQGEITIEERSRLFVELINKRKKHFAKLRAEEKRRKPPTKAQKRNLMSTYLKNMGGYKYNQLKSKSYDEIQKLFDNEMKRVNTFIHMDSEVMKSKEGTEESSKRIEDELEFDKSKKAESSEKKAEGSRKKSIGKKRAGKEQKQESSKRQRMEDDKETDEHEEAKEYDKAQMKKHMEVVQDDEEIAIDDIPLATKPPIIVEYKIVKEGQKGFYYLIRANGSSNRYSSIIRMLQNISREDLETLWKLGKTKHRNTRPEDDYEKVFRGDLKVMFEPDIKSEIWRSLQGYKVTVWKLFDSSGVHFVRFKNLHIFMLVKKIHPLTPITITNMLNEKLQADYWNEMCYQLLKLMGLEVSSIRRIQGLDMAYWGFLGIRRIDLVSFVVFATDECKEATEARRGHMVKSLVNSSIHTESSGTVSGIQNVSNSLGNKRSIKENENSVSGNENRRSDNKCNKSGISSSISENDMKSDGVDIRPTNDTNSLEQVDNDDYNVFAIEKEHPKQPESVSDTYLVEQGDTNTILDLTDMSNNRGEADQDDDLTKEHDLLASLIEQMKLEIDGSKNINKYLESSNKTL